MNDVDNDLKRTTAAAKSAMDATAKRGRPKGPGVSDAAKTTAAMILEALAGLRGPSDAARELGVSVMRFYQLEKRAIDGLIAACEPRPIGRQPSGGPDPDRLMRECERLRHDVTRHQALLRSAQRALGVQPAPAAGTKAEGAKRAKRQPTVRALSIAKKLRVASEPQPDGEASASTTIRADSPEG